MPVDPPNGTNVPRVDRRLAAIAFIDIVGYSILMAREETRTHQRWMGILDEVIRPQTTRHRGQVVVTGTGNLVHAVTSMLARNHIIAAELRVEQASLDDAFVALTGRRLDSPSTTS